MLIECKLRRPGGSLVTLGETDYHFKPDTEDGPHTCEVADKDHAKSLLAIDVYATDEPDEEDESIELSEAEAARAVTVSQMNIEELSTAVKSLSRNELAYLRQLELDGAQRKTALSAIEHAFDAFE